MAEGDITASLEYTGNISGTAFLTEVGTFNTAGSVSARDKASFHFIPHGNGQVSVIKMLRSAT